MPVNEEEPAPDPTLVDRITPRVRDVIVGTNPSMPIRVVILFIISICVCTLAPTPANIVGVAAVVLLALDTAARRR